MERAPLDAEERKARGTNQLVREAEMENFVRVTPTPPDDDD